MDAQLREFSTRLDSLNQEMEQRHNHLDKRIIRSRAAEHELRSREGAPATGLQPLPPGMKMPKLKRCDAKSEKAMRQWFRQLSAYLKAYQMTEDDSRAVFFASQHFDGALETWWQSCVEETEDSVSAGFTSIRTLADAALKQFSGRDMADVARDKPDRVRQTGSVRAYANIVRESLVYLPHRTEGDNIHTFKRGLKPSLSQALALRKPESLAKAIEMALEVEAAQTTRSTAADRKSARSDVDLNALDGESDEEDFFSDNLSEDNEEGADGDDEVEDTDVNNVETGRPSKATVMKWRKEGRCLRCGQKGHFSKDCPNRKASGDR